MINHCFIINLVLTKFNDLIKNIRLIIIILKINSSSVRRSSFREKEKAARKLDTSFKDVLYANEQQENAVNDIPLVISNTFYTLKKNYF
jgi:hypothetical protein